MYSECLTRYEQMEHKVPTIMFGLCSTSHVGAVSPLRNVLGSGRSYTGRPTETESTNIDVGTLRHIRNVLDCQSSVEAYSADPQYTVP